MASFKPTTGSTASIPYSSRKFIDDIPPEKRSLLCTEIDYTIHKNEGYWQKLIDRLGFDETHSKKFKLSFEMRGSPTDNLLRDCSHRMLRIRHLYQILTEIGLVHLAEAYLKDFDTEESIPSYATPNNNLESYSWLRQGCSLYDASMNKSYSQNSKGPTWRGIDTIHFSHDVIKAGTNNFSPKMELGAGAFGKVYKVMLNNTLFACKVLKIDKDNQLTTSLIEKHRQHEDLRNELNYLAEYRHPNVIALYGWSLDGPDPCLIYDYMKNGSLQDRLQRLNGSPPLNWEVRIKVSCGAARGLQFLHTMKSKALIHGDIKTANILLDNSFTAKLGDFGLAREMPHNATTGSYIKLGNEHTPGTLGYLANEYIKTKKLSVEVDTYAFGVVLLELYTGRRAYDRQKENPLLRDYMDDVANDVDKIGEEKTKSKLFHLQDPRIPKLSQGPAFKFVHLALACCHQKRKERPKMLQTLSELNEIERTVAVANGKEPEESIQITNDEEPQGSSWLKKYPSEAAILSRNPVESVDQHSLGGGECYKGLMQGLLSAAWEGVFGKTLNDTPEGGHEDWHPCLLVHLIQIFNVQAEAWSCELFTKLPLEKDVRNAGRSEKPPGAALEAKFDRMQLQSSSSDESDCQGPSMDPTHNLPPHQMHPVYPMPGPNPVQYGVYPSPHLRPIHGTPGIPLQPPRFQPPPCKPVFTRGYMNGRTPLRTHDSTAYDCNMYGAGPYSCPASRRNVTNPFNLDLTKVPRPPCTCNLCQPNQTPIPWSGQVDCAPGMFTSGDYKGPASFGKGGRLDADDISPCQPGPSTVHREPNEMRESLIDSAAQTPLTPPSSFHFHPSNSMLSETAPLSINPVKESLMDKLKDGQTYTQIFQDVKRIPTEGSSDDTFSK